MASVSARAAISRPPDNLGYIVVDALPQDLVSDLADAGVSEDDLRAIAGRDGVIRGEDELDNLFARIDEPRIAAPHGRSLFDALHAEINRNRQRAGNEGGRRFSHDANLTNVMDGGPSLGPGANAPSIYRVEQALADIGLLNAVNVDGLFGDATLHALELFQLETELLLTGRIDAATLGALSAVAPAPGDRLVRRPEYDRMGTDRLDVTFGLGTGDQTFARVKTELEAVAGLMERGFERAAPAGGRSPHVEQWVRGPVTLHVVMPQANDPASLAAAARAVTRSGAVIWSGRRLAIDHAGRPAAGLRRSAPDRPQNRGPEYQLICASGCVDADAAQERLLGRNVDTDLFATKDGAPEHTRAQHALHFLDTILARGNTDDLERGTEGLATTERGFLHNRSNTTERS